NDGIVDVSSSGEFTIAPFTSSNPADLRTLRIPRPTDGGANEFYDLSFRYPELGTVDESPHYGGLDTGVVIELEDDTTNTSFTLDPVAGSPPPSSWGISAGAPFTDINGVSVTTVSTSDAGAVVDVTVPSSYPGC